jgi:hypothetical protein
VIVRSMEEVLLLIGMFNNFFACSIHFDLLHTFQIEYKVRFNLIIFQWTVLALQFQLWIFDMSYL